MKKSFNYTLTAAAVSIALAGMSANVGAFDVTGGGDGYANNLFGSATALISTYDNISAVDIDAQNGDAFLGRTTGFNVVVTLDKGTFQATITDGMIAVGTALPDDGVGTPWTASVAGGGTTTDNSVTISVQEGTGSTGIIAGTMLTFAAPNIAVNGLDADMADVGDTLSVAVVLNDPVGGNPLASANEVLNTNVAGTGVTAAFTANINATPDTITDQRVDVGSTASPSKTTISQDGSIDGTQSDIFNAGELTIAPAGDCSTAAAAHNNCDANAFVFDAADTVTVTVTGDDLDAFNQTGGSLYLDTGGDCATGLIDAAATTAGTGTTGTTSMSVSYDIAAPGGDSFFVCLAVPGGNTMVIDDQALTYTVAIDLNDADLIDPPNATGDLQPLVYNGTVREAHFVNPGTNTTQLSMLSVNATGIGGLVTFSAVDDAGSAAPGGDVTMTLVDYGRAWISAADLENGNTAKGLTGAFGDGTGKWHVTVTCECDGMEVQAFIRTPDGFLTNVSGLAPDSDGDH